MKVLYAGLRAENYDERRKPSFEYVNFYGTLARMPGVTVIECPFDPIVSQGRIAWNAELVARAERERPDVFFAFMYSDELDLAALRTLKERVGVKTIAWFADDYWRFWNYSRFFAPHFDCVVTTSRRALDWYTRAGFRNAVLSQWAANTAVFRPVPATQDIGVSFVGQYKPQRAALLRTLERAGVNVEAFGSGWPNGRVAPEELPNIFSRSKINVNLNVRRSRFDPWTLGRIFFTKSRNRVVPSIRVLANFRAWAHTATPHLHARVFEILACNAFLISGRAEDTQAYYDDGTDFVSFDGSAGDLEQKVRYYLDHVDERLQISRAGYERTIREHTYDHRFTEIFRNLGVTIP